MKLIPILLALAASVVVATAADEPLRPVGVARVDITPDYPIRLTGYGDRKEESTGVAQRLFAKALAFGGDADGPAVLVTVDNCAVPGAVREEVVRRLATKTKVLSDRFALCSTHNHSAPMLSGVLPNMFSADLPAEQQATVDRYTRELTDKIEQAALAALADRKPARLAWGVGRVGFAANRRLMKDGKVIGMGDNLSAPVDHDLPVLRVTDADGKVRAVFTSYACHCTTLTGKINQMHGDWAGCAQEALEREFPGAVALIAQGCGADANPSPRGELAMAVQHGETLAAEAKRLVTGTLKPLAGALECRAKRIELAFDTPRTRAEWEQLAQAKTARLSYHARKNIARLDRGETLPTHLPYFVQTWTFGDDLAMVFLAGEVVVDYSLRLKREFGARLWVNSYANDVPCYIPSRRILSEGGYEAEGAMAFYDRPTKLAPEVEERIVGTVHELMPKQFPATVSPPAGLKSALLFHASFDQGVDADFATGDAKLYSAPGGKRAEAKPGLPEGGLVQLAKSAGRFGGALRFTQKMKPQVFFQGAKNLGYRTKDWSGACSFWMRLDPDKDLEPGYCDPLQFVAQVWGEGNMFVEFSKDHTPRHFRYALLPITRLWNPANRKWEDIPEPERPMVPVHQPPFRREQWTHVCFTFGNANTGAKDGWGKLYLDGKLQGAFTGFESSFNWDEAQSALTLGLNYIGWFDDVAVFNRALTDAEVRTIFEAKDGIRSLK